LGDTPSAGKDKTGVLIGNFLIIFAQLVVAIQMCVEEKIITVYNTPALKVVGLEGTFGFCILGTLLLPMYFIKIDGYPFENTPDAIVQFGENPVIALAMLGNIFSIAFFNFFGISITKNMSASHRMVLDSVRTLIVWGASLALKWEEFHALQLVGFFLLSMGIAMYNEVFTFPSIFKYPDEDDPKRSFVGDGEHGSFLANCDGAEEEPQGQRGGVALVPNQQGTEARTVKN